MEPRKLFINSATRLRSGWRLAVFGLAFIAFLFLFTSAVRAVYAAGIYFAPSITLGFYVQDIVYRLILLTASLAAGYVCARLLEDLSWRSLGLTLHANWFRDLLIGTAIGIASLALAATIATVGGGLRFTVSAAGIFAQVAKTLGLSGALFIVAALAEEALFRGYPLQTLTRARLAVLGVLLTSLPFAAVHLQNPNVAQGFTFVNTALAGVWLAVAYLRTRSLWFPLGVHWAWNWALGSLFGLPVSGITQIAPHPLLQGADLGPAWLTGGSYGIEGGLACTITLVISTVFVWRTGLVSATDQMKMLTSQENPKQRDAELPVVASTTIHEITRNDTNRISCWFV
ncbi:MAG: CPBP family intramembrane metalloprotease [Acidobacteriota bacterium]|nr:CPBP family intramembrane metalloprotease [Acidobacteriota bacterium]